MKENKRIPLLGYDIDFEYALMFGKENDDIFKEVRGFRTKVEAREYYDKAFENLIQLRDEGKE